MRTLTLALALVVALGVTVAKAQEGDAGYGVSSGGYYGVPAYGGGFWGGGPRHSSTFQEGVMRGMGDLVRSVGQANLSNSLAARNIEEARSRYIDNRLKATDAYFSMRQRNREARAAEQGPRPTSEQLFRLAKQGVPKRMSPSELDPITGGINWPLVLKGDEFAPYREKIDQLFAQRAKSQGHISMDEYQSIEQATKEMEAELKKYVRDIPPQQYTEARSFLGSLNHELNFPG